MSMAAGAASAAPGNWCNTKMKTHVISTNGKVYPGSCRRMKMCCSMAASTPPATTMAQIKVVPWKTNTSATPTNAALKPYSPACTSAGLKRSNRAVSVPATVAISAAAPKCRPPTNRPTRKNRPVKRSPCSMICPRPFRTASAKGQRRKNRSMCVRRAFMEIGSVAKVVRRVAWASRYCLTGPSPIGPEAMALTMPCECLEEPRSGLLRHNSLLRRSGYAKAKSATARVVHGKGV